MSATSLDSHIETTPGVCGGRPRIAGRRITVAQIASRHIKQDWPVSQIVSELDLSEADVHAALAYFFDHRQEIESSWQRDLEIEEESMARNPSLISQEVRDAFRNQSASGE